MEFRATIWEYTIGSIAGSTSLPTVYHGGSSFDSRFKVDIFKGFVGVCAWREVCQRLTIELGFVSEFLGVGREQANWSCLGRGDSTQLRRVPLKHVSLGCFTHLGTPKACKAFLDATLLGVSVGDAQEDTTTRDKYRGLKAIVT